MRRPTDDLSVPHEDTRARELADYLREVALAPHRHHFFQVLRRVEALTPGLPRLGCAPRPAQEPLRIAQTPSLAFAPAPIASLECAFDPDENPDADADTRARPARLSQYFFGLLGPNGPLPLHLTEYARDRLLHEHDETLARFLDLLTHRYALLFYRAFAQAQPAASLDRAGDDRFGRFIGALFGIGHASCQHRDAAHDHLKLRHAMHFAKETRPPEGLLSILADGLRVPLRLEPFVCERLAVAADERLTLGASRRLGESTVLGAHVLTRQFRFRLIAGALTLAEFVSLLPGGERLPVLTALVRQYLNRELAWDVHLVLQRDEVPELRLGRGARLGWTTFFAGRPGDTQAASGPLIDAEMRVPLPGPAHPPPQPRSNPRPGNSSR
ncbi:type VI secretion system baseplate subunit TssG [Burkholderia sp. S171]|uniref:type VI secretion system baseplate subunit TssG n=1 Tax=Burkholderia sp. S171 TaxID=1641860 RepID=UPI00131DB726|nr:type VI secretion system baseplate subunit TssG [Burkholderia sp. S171]